MTAYLFAHDLWLQKHTTFPYIGSGRRGDTQMRADALAAAADYLQSHKRPVVGEKVAYSDAPLWHKSCGASEISVRAIAPIINSANGEVSDATMYFCYARDGTLYPAD